MAHWFDSVPALARIAAADDGVAATLLAARRVRVAAGDAVFQPGAPCEGFVVVLRGEVRVSLTSASAREVVLYRVLPGEPCVVTTASLLASASYPAEGVASGATELASLDAASFEQLLGASRAFRRYVFSTFGDRILDLTRLVDAVAFGDVRARVAQALLDLVPRDETRLVATHRELAAEVGTAREVVSRHLEALQSRRNPRPLARLARGARSGGARGAGRDDEPHLVSDSVTDARGGPRETGGTMQKNVGTLDRGLRIVLGLVLLALVFVGPETPLGWIGLVPLLTGLASHCPLYSLLGLRTCPLARDSNF